MRVTLFLNPGSWTPEDDHPVVEHTIKQAIAADAAGFSAVFLTEHHFSGVNGYCDPFMMGARLAGQMQQAYLGIAVVTVPYHHPLRIVESASILDVMTQGRCIVGLGAGGVTKTEWDAFGADPALRHEVTEQRIEVIERAFAHRPCDPDLDVSTDWDSGSLGGRLMPISYRRPRPLLARATASDHTIRETGERGWPVMFGLDPTPDQIALYEEGLEIGGHPRDTVKECRDWLAHSKYIWVGETDAEAQQSARGPVEALAAHSHHLTRRVGQEARTEPIFSGPEDFIERSFVIGSPETVAEKLLQLEEETGLSHVRTWFKFGTVGVTAAERSFALFSESVLPRLSPERIDGPAPVRSAAAV